MKTGNFFTLFVGNSCHAATSKLKFYHSQKSRFHVTLLKKKFIFYISWIKIQCPLVSNNHFYTFCNGISGFLVETYTGISASTRTFPITFLSSSKQYTSQIYSNILFRERKKKKIYTANSVMLNIFYNIYYMTEFRRCWNFFLNFFLLSILYILKQK